MADSLTHEGCEFESGAPVQINHIEYKTRNEYYYARYLVRELFEIHVTKIKKKN